MSLHLRNPKVKKLTTKPLKIVELEHRVAKLEDTVYSNTPKPKIIITNLNTRSSPNLNADTTSNFSPSSDNEKSVYEELRLWLSSPATRRVDEYLKAQSTSNEVRQALFMRQQKAIQKYGGGLKILSDGISNVRRVTEKLSDGIFFLFQALFGTGIISQEDIKLVENLHSLVGLLIKEHKNKKV